MGAHKSQTRAERMEANDCRTCPRCGGVSKRVATRREVHGVHRRRQCSATECGWRWTTIEVDLVRIRAVTELERVLAFVINKIKKLQPEFYFAEDEPRERARAPKSPISPRSEIPATPTIPEDDQNHVSDR